MEAETEKAIALGVLGGAAFLLADIRFEHREVLGETWAAWIPLTYAVLLLVAGGAAIIRFDRGGRGVLRILFAAAVAVGALGIWFHSAGHPFRSVVQVLSSFALTPGNNGGIKIGSEPPPLAPAAFCGLGFIGVIACGRPRRRPLRVAAGSLPAPSLASGSGLERRADSPP